MPCPFRLPWFDQPHNMWPGVQIMQPLITQFRPFSCYFIPLRPKYLPSRLFSNTLGPCFSPVILETKFHTNLKQKKKLYFCTPAGAKFTWHSTLGTLFLVSRDFCATLYFNFQIDACFNVDIKQFSTMSSRAREGWITTLYEKWSRTVACLRPKQLTPTCNSWPRCP